MIALAAPAKINLALVVGARRTDGKHEVVTVLERISLADRIRIRSAASLAVAGLEEDTLVGAALDALAAEAGVAPLWSAEIEKRIPVAAGLGGGSSDAAAALRLANSTLDPALDDVTLHRIAARLGADVPFFLTEGPQLGEGDGTELSPLELPRDYTVLLLLPHDGRKTSTAEVYAEFDRRNAPAGFPDRRAAVLEAAARADLRGLPPNDLSSSPLADELRDLGAFRADVSGAGPTVYALFADDLGARSAAEVMGPRGQTWIERPSW